MVEAQQNEDPLYRNRIHLATAEPKNPRSHRRLQGEAVAVLVVADVAGKHRADCSNVLVIGDRDIAVAVAVNRTLHFVHWGRHFEAAEGNSYPWNAAVVW